MLCFLIVAAIAQTKGEAKIFSRLALTDGPQFPRLFPHPTGRNGCEEYVKASDLLKSKGANAYQLWLYGLERHDPVDSPPPGVHRTDDLATVEQKYVTRFKKVLTLVEAGNRKPFQSFFKKPKSTEDAALSPIVDFPIQASFRQIAKLQTRAADVEFNKGRPDRAVQILVDGLNFTNNVSAGSTIAVSTGHGSSTLIQDGFANHARSVTVEGARLMGSAAISQIKEVPKEVDALKAEARIAEMNIRTFLTGPESLSARPEGLTQLGLSQAAIQEFKALSPSQVKALPAKLTQRVNWDTEKAIAILKGPERHWTKFAAPQASGEFESSILEMTSLSLTSKILQAAVTHRERLHLLLLTCKILAYRETHGELPKALTDCASRLETKDGFYGGTYQYHPQNGWFTLRSRKLELGHKTR